MSAQIIPSKTPAEAGLAETFTAVKAQLPGTPEIAKLREAHFSAFVEAGLPHRRVETWHYTDLRTLMREALPIAPAPTPASIETLRAAMAEAKLPGQKIVLVDGVYVPELSDSLPQGVSVKSLSSVLSEGPAELLDELAAGGLGSKDSIVALNGALMVDGAIIVVAPGAAVEEPLQLVSATVSAVPVAQFSRSLIVIGEKASVRLNQTHFGDSGKLGQAFNVLIAKVGDEAFFGHTAMVSGSQAGSVQFESLMVRLGAKTKFDSFALVDGAGLIRRQIYLRFDGEDAEGALRGACLLRGREHADTTLFVEHLAPGCSSRELFKYILDEEAVGVFQGKFMWLRPLKKLMARCSARLCFCVMALP